MSDYQGWTLEQHEEVTSVNLFREPLGRIIRAMQQTGYQKWGFTIYRCTYSDEEAWHRYVQCIKDSFIKSLDFHGRQFLLEKYLDLPVIEDRTQLDGASKPTVRSMFAERAERDRQTDHGGPGTASHFAMMMPRFNYCLYVDQLCLDTLLAREQWQRERDQGLKDKTELPPYVICAIIDTDCEPGGEGKDGYESIEGCTRWFPGWMYCRVDLLTSLYNRLHFEELVDGYKTYERPPGIPDTRGKRMPLT